jgi:hypothetical protein
MADPIEDKARDLLVLADKIFDSIEHRTPSLQFPTSGEAEAISEWRSDFARLSALASASAQAPGWRPISEIEWLRDLNLPPPRPGQHVGRVITMPDGRWVVIVFDQDTERYTFWPRLSTRLGP